MTFWLVKYYRPRGIGGQSGGEGGGRESPKEHVCEIILKSIQPFRRKLIKGFSIFSSCDHLGHQTKTA